MPDFETAWANKEAALDGYKRALAALNEYLDAAHDAMQAGLEVIKTREAQI